MRIVFFGTSCFSAEILRFLSTLPHQIVGVVTRTDKPQGRDLKLGVSPVKKLLLSEFPQIPLFQPEKASTEAFCDQIRSLKPDLFLVVAYGEILKSNILSLPAKACINIHTSLLPKYRGAAPIQRALINGEAFSGVTFMEMALKMDAGDILLQEVVPISKEMNAVDLESSLLEASKRRLPEFLAHFDSYYSVKEAQNESNVTFAAKITPPDSLIDWAQSSLEIHNRIRALSPSPGAYVNLEFGPQIKRLKILKSCPFVSLEKESPGKIQINRNSFRIFTGDGFLELLEVQLEGKRVMSVEEFLRGVPKHLSLVL